MFVAGIAVAVGACSHIGVKLLVHLVLVIDGLRVELGPVIGGQSGFLGLLGKCRIVFVALVDACGKCHYSSKVIAGGHTLLHHIALLVTIGGHDKALEIGSRQFVVNASVIGILHGDHPLEIKHELVKQVCSAVAALGNVGVETIEILFVLLIGHEHQSHRIG